MESENSHVSRIIGLTVDGTGKDPTDSSHPDHDGGSDRFFGMGDGIISLISQDRGDVCYGENKEDEYRRTSRPKCRGILGKLTLSTHDGQKRSKVPNIRVPVIPDDSASDQTDDGVDTDEETSLAEFIGADGDTEGVDRCGRVGGCGEAEGFEG
jgi:hypothetical protein